MGRVKSNRKSGGAGKAKDAARKEARKEGARKEETRKDRDNNPRGKSGQPQNRFALRSDEGLPQTPRPRRPVLLWISGGLVVAWIAFLIYTVATL